MSNESIEQEEALHESILFVSRAPPGLFLQSHSRKALQSVGHIAHGECVRRFSDSLPSPFYW
jgi:hypothetical protein